MPNLFPNILLTGKFVQISVMRGVFLQLLLIAIFKFIYKRFYLLRYCTRMHCFCKKMTYKFDCTLCCLELWLVQRSKLGIKSLIFKSGNNTLEPILLLYYLFYNIACKLGFKSIFLTNGQFCGMMYTKTFSLDSIKIVYCSAMKRTVI